MFDLSTDASSARTHLRIQVEEAVHARIAHISSLSEKEREILLQRILEEIQHSPLGHTLRDQHLPEELLDQWIRGAAAAPALPIVTAQIVYAALRIPLEIVKPHVQTLPWGTFPEVGERFCAMVAHQLNLLLGFCETCGAHIPGQVQEINRRSICPVCLASESEQKP